MSQPPMTRHLRSANAASTAHAAVRPPELDWAQLQVPITSAEPSGPNLEYSAEFAELELLARGTPDRQMGSALAPGRAPDRTAVLQQAAALLHRTKDIRVLVQLLGACLPILGVASFVRGLGALRQLLDCFWDSVHPALDPDDEARSTARANATMASASPELVWALRHAPLLESPGGERVCLNDALLALRDTGSEGRLSASAAQLSKILREQPPGVLAALASSLQDGLKQTDAITASFAARSGAVPDLQPLQRFFQDALALLGPYRLTPAAADGAPDTSRSGKSSAAPWSAPAWLACATPSSEWSEQARVGRNFITSRDDVSMVLEELCAYYHAHEPASPLPLLLRRCQRLVGLDFLATLRELAPAALTDVALIAGSSPE